MRWNVSDHYAVIKLFHSHSLTHLTLFNDKITYERERHCAWGGERVYCFQGNSRKSEKKVSLLVIIEFFTSSAVRSILFLVSFVDDIHHHNKKCIHTNSGWGQGFIFTRPKKKCEKFFTNVHVTFVWWLQKFFWCLCSCVVPEGCIWLCSLVYLWIILYEIVSLSTLFLFIYHFIFHIVPLSFVCFYLFKLIFVSFSTLFHKMS